jgi:hypothetical protein
VNSKGVHLATTGPLVSFEVPWCSDLQTVRVKRIPQAFRMESFTVSQRRHNHKVAFLSKSSLDRPEDHFSRKNVSRVLGSRGWKKFCLSGILLVLGWICSQIR